MKRKKQILLYLLLMATCVGGYMKLFDYRLTPHQYFAAEEKYQHVGPSEEILLEGEGAEGTYFILGKWGQNLNYCVMERHMGIFWGSRSGGHYVFPEDDRLRLPPLWGEYQSDMDVLYGICQVDGVTQVQYTLSRLENNEVYYEGTLPVREDGYFYGNHILEEYQKNQYGISSMIGTDAQGNVLAEYTW